MSNENRKYGTPPRKVEKKIQDEAAENTLLLIDALFGKHPWRRCEILLIKSYRVDNMHIYSHGNLLRSLSRKKPCSRRWWGRMGFSRTLDRRFEQ
eukprot:scaffold2780_cov174-Amphora_coffeaeformis.AAC.12